MEPGLLIPSAIPVIATVIANANNLVYLIAYFHYQTMIIVVYNIFDKKVLFQPKT
jgi:hypothetical protein